MAINTLTDKNCRDAVNNNGKLKKYSDGHGMYLAVLPSGNKVWRMAYHFSGTEKTAVIGPYPLVSLKDARERRDALRLKLLDGIDPNAAVKAKKSITFEKASVEYLGTKGDNQNLTNEQTLRGLQMWVYPYIGQMDIATVTKDDVLEIFGRMAKVGKRPYLTKMRSWTGGVFKWAIEHEYCKVNHPRSIELDTAYGKKKTVHHAHVPLSGVRALLERIDEEPVTTVVLATKLFSLTWLRSKELRYARWDEIEGDTLSVPGLFPNGQRRMKSGNDHIVPLSKQALKILEELKNRCRKSPYIMPSEHKPEQPISENAVRAFLNNIGYKGRQTCHGFRAIGSTWGGEFNYPESHVEFQLSHTVEDRNEKVKRAYNKAQYIALRRKMMQDYADWLDNPDTSGIESA